MKKFSELLSEDVLEEKKIPKMDGHNSIDKFYSRAKSMYDAQKVSYEESMRVGKIAETFVVDFLKSHKKQVTSISFKYPLNSSSSDYFIIFEMKEEPDMQALRIEFSKYISAIDDNKIKRIPTVRFKLKV